MIVWWNRNINGLNNFSSIFKFYCLRKNSLLLQATIFSCFTEGYGLYNLKWFIVSWNRSLRYSYSWTQSGSLFLEKLMSKICRVTRLRNIWNILDQYRSLYILRYLLNYLWRWNKCIGIGSKFNLRIYSYIFLEELIWILSSRVNSY